MDNFKLNVKLKKEIADIEYRNKYEQMDNINIGYQQVELSKSGT